MHPVNLGLRFLLELAALAGIGLWAWRLAPGWAGWAVAIAAVAAAAALWGMFNVPGDPSRSGAAPVPVPGTVRLALELALLFGGAAALWASGNLRAGIIIGLLVLVHYIWGHERVAWLLRQ